MPSFLMQQLELFPPPLELKPIPPEAEDPDFLQGINSFLMNASLPIRIYSTAPQFHPELIYKIWHLTAEKPLFGLYSEQEIWALAKAFYHQTDANLWRYVKDGKAEFILGTTSIALIIDEIICPDVWEVKEMRFKKYRNRG